MTEWQFISNEELSRVLSTAEKGDLRLSDGVLQVFNGETWEPYPTDET